MSLESTIEGPIRPNPEGFLGLLKRELHPSSIYLRFYHFHFGIVVPAFEKAVMAPVYFGAVGAVKFGRSIYRAYLSRNHRDEPEALDAVQNNGSYWRDIKISDRHDRMY